MAGPGLAEPVAHARPARLQLVDRVVDGRGVDVDAARQLGEERRQRHRQMQLGHGVSR